MDITTGQETGEINEKTTKTAKQIKAIESKLSEGTIVNIPERGIEMSVIHDYPANVPFYGKTPSGDINQYVIINNRVYKTANNLVEV